MPNTNCSSKSILRLWLAVGTVLSPAVQCVFLRMNWEICTPEYLDSTQAKLAICEFGAFPNLNFEQIEILEVSKVATDTNKILLICRNLQKETSLFFVALTKTPDTANLLTLTTVGGHIPLPTTQSFDIQDYIRQVKKTAENYKKTAYAFQEVWERVSDVRASHETFMLSRFCDSETARRRDSRKTNDFSLQRFWYFWPRAKFVGVYQNSVDGTAAVVRIQLGRNNETDEQWTEYDSLINAYGAVSNLLENDLAFVPGWTRDREILKQYEMLLESVGGNVPWIPEGSQLCLYGVNVNGSTVATMLVFSNTFPLLGVCIIWKILDQKRFEFLHGGRISTILDAASDHTSFYDFEELLNFPKSDFGTNWYKAVNTFNSKIEKLFTNGISVRMELAKPISLIAFKLLPSGLPETFQNLNLFIVFLVNDDEPYYSFAKVGLYRTDFVCDTVVYKEERHTELKNAISEADYFMASPIHRWYWKTEATEKFQLEIKAAKQFSLMAELESLQNTLTVCEVDQMKLILIVSTQPEKEEFTKSFYIAYSKFTKNGSYQVTWIGLPLEIGLRKQWGLKTIKMEAQEYYKRAFAFTEFWKLCQNITEQESTNSVYAEWSFSETKKIQLKMHKQENQKLYYFEAEINSQGVVYQGMKGGIVNTVAEALADLQLSLSNENLFLKPTTIELELILATKMTDLKQRLENMNHVSLEFKNIRYPSTDITKLVVSFAITKQNRTDKESEKDTDSPQIITTVKQIGTCESCGCEILVPVQEKVSKFVIVGKIKKVVRDAKFKNEVNNFTMDPLIFGGDLRQFGMNEKLPQGEEELILDAAPWDMESYDGIYVQISWNTDRKTPGTVARVCSLGNGENAPCFFMVWYSKADLGSLQKLKYVGGLGTQQNARDEYMFYMKSLVPFQETIFREYVAWYTYNSEEILLIRQNAYELLQAEFNVSNINRVSPELFKKWEVARIAATAYTLQKNVTMYGIFGPVERNAVDVLYISATIKVISLHGKHHFHSILLGYLRGSFFQAEHDLLEFAQMQHKMHSVEQ